MADRYLRATGNWNGAVWAATSGGAAGSAAAPTSADYVYIDQNYSVTLTANAICSQVVHTNGTLNLNGYTLDPGIRFASTGSTSRTLILNGKIQHTYDGYILWQRFEISGSNVTINPAGSTIELSWQKDEIEYGNTIALGNFTYNDLIINLGVGSSESIPLNITGSPTFRSLIIQSKNSAAHTVNLPKIDSNTEGAITVDKLIVLGSSSNNLALNCNTGTISPGQGWKTLNVLNSSYGQYVSTTYSGMFDWNVLGSTPLYIGSNSSIASGAGDNFLTQDPPKVSTFVDPCTITPPSSNTNWDFGGNAVARTDGYYGGGYERLSSSPSAISTDTYDFIDNTYVWQILLYGPGGASAVFWKLFYGSGGNWTRHTSNDGINWTLDASGTLTEQQVLEYRSMRFTVSGNLSIGAVNPSLTVPNTGAFLPFFL